MHIKMHILLIIQNCYLCKIMASPGLSRLCTINSLSHWTNINIIDLLYFLSTFVKLVDLRKKQPNIMRILKLFPNMTFIIQIVMRHPILFLFIIYVYKQVTIFRRFCKHLAKWPLFYFFYHYFLLMTVCIRI